MDNVVLVPCFLQLKHVNCNKCDKRFKWFWPQYATYVIVLVICFCVCYIFVCILALSCMCTIYLLCATKKLYKRWEDGAPEEYNITILGMSLLIELVLALPILHDWLAVSNCLCFWEKCAKWQPLQNLCTNSICRQFLKIRSPFKSWQ